VKRSESIIVRACCDYLAAKRHFFWRQNNAGIMRTDLKGRKFWTTPVHSRKGVPDIFVLVKDVVSRFFAVEVKTEVGRQSPEQRQFQEEWEQRGGVYVLARGVDALIEVGL